MLYRDCFKNANPVRPDGSFVGDEPVFVLVLGEENLLLLGANADLEDSFVERALKRAVLA